MKTGYVDTNVVFSKYKPTDPYHHESIKTLQSNRINKISSPLLIVELTSIISRQLHLANIVLPKEVEKLLNVLSFEKQVFTLVAYMIYENSIDILSVKSSEKLKIKTKQISIHINYFRSYVIAPELRLKTLDVLHIASMINLSIYHGITIDYFVTGDNDILENKKGIENITGIQVVSPSHLTKIENI